MLSKMLAQGYYGSRVLMLWQLVVCERIEVEGGVKKTKRKRKEHGTEDYGSTFHAYRLPM